MDARDHPPTDEGMAAIRAALDRTDALLRKQRADRKEQADWLAAVLRSDPARFRAILALASEQDYLAARAEKQARDDAVENRRLQAIKSARRRREAEEKDG